MTVDHALEPLAGHARNGAEYDASALQSAGTEDLLLDLLDYNDVHTAAVGPVTGTLGPP
ncbi:MAG: hypothetical protein ABI560_00015 [Myxococcales bacterium]